MATPIPRNHASFRLTELGSVGSIVGGDVVVRSVSTDTRDVEPGALFVALRGESFDGHRFVADAVSKGAAAVVVSDRSKIPRGVPALVVDDTLVALGAIARIHRERWGKTVVAITGSAGKTTTKELVAASLAGTGLSVRATEGNLNNQVGVPMMLLTLDASHDVAVIEMGTSESGEIAKLASIAKPDIALITSIGLSHALGIGSIDDVAEEKGALFDALDSSGVAIINRDDPRIASRSVRCRRIEYGSSEAVDVRIVDRRLESDGARATIAVRGVNDPLDIRISIPSLVALDNAAAAIAVAVSLGRSPVDAAVGMRHLAPIEGRMRPLTLSSGALVLDDTYNANPRSMAASLETASRLASERGGRLVAVLGEMRELGEHATDAHVELGQKVVDVGAARLVGVGPEMAPALERAREGGVPTASVEDSSGAHTHIGPIGPRDVILVKGSRSMRMERVVEALRAAEVTP